MTTVDMITEDMTVTPGMIGIIMAPLTRHVYRGDLDGRYYGTSSQDRFDEGTWAAKRLLELVCVFVEFGIVLLELDSMKLIGMWAAIVWFDICNRRIEPDI